MCGIIGYTGSSQALPILIQGIRLLSYRGYDSAGVAIHNGERLTIEKDQGRIADLAPRWDPAVLAGTTGIGHTRWATHGVPNRVNSHPQHDADGIVAVVHNGIIENDLALRAELQSDGVVFVSDTDTEVLAHLFARNYTGDAVAAARALLAKCHGAFALAIVHKDRPGELIAVRRGSPLLIGLGVRENLVSSDSRALAGRVDEVAELPEDHIAIVRADGVEAFDVEGKAVTLARKVLDAAERDTDKGGYPHFMLKEVHEQPDRLYELLAGHVNWEQGALRLDEIKMTDAAWQAIERIDLVGCGTAFHACLYGAYLFERLAGIPARAIWAHEYDTREPRFNPNVLVIAVSQSGETMDTKVAIQLAKDGGAQTLGVLNVSGSVIGRTVDGLINMHSGIEVGVASTKAYTGMLTSLALLAMRAGETRGGDANVRAVLLSQLRDLPDIIRTAIEEAQRTVPDVVREIYRTNHMLYLGRGPDAATALEGALKMKEISYIHAEGYAAGEMKHGPIALISFEMPTVAIATPGPWRDRMIGNVREVKARDGLVVLVAGDGDGEAPQVADFVLSVPVVDPLLSPIVNVIPLQLLAYETAKRRGCDIDQPRNLAKTVTVQ